MQAMDLVLSDSHDSVLLAARFGFTEILKRLLEAAGNEGNCNLIERKDKDGLLLTHIAARGGHLATLRFFLLHFFFRRRSIYKNP